MAKIKNEEADLKIRYKVYFEISLVISLAFLIAAFKFFPDMKSKELIVEAPQELFKIEDIAQTKQETPPPPPPKPSIIIESPSDEILEDIEFESTEIDYTAEVLPPPPPPPSKTKIMEDEPAYFEAVEEMPAPIGGIKAIQEKIKYPEIARRAGVEGTVYILAYLSEQGNVVKTEVIKGLGGGCDEAAAEAVAATKFYPGKQRGKAVRVKVMVPIKFQLADKLS